jgi:hypothetical protein
MQHNAIEELDGLSTLVKLQVISLGSNLLNDVKQTADYLRQLKSVQAISLKDNPLCTESDEYPDRILAVVPQLRYLDWVKIVDESRIEAFAKFAIAVDNLELLESEQKQKDDQAADTEKIALTLIEDGAPEMDGGMWFDRLLPTLSEINLLCTVPGISESIETLRAHFGSSSEPIRAAARTFTETRLAIESSIEEALVEGRQDRLEGQCRPLIDAWSKEKDAVFDVIEATGHNASGALKV